jgi:hypothetical protein
MKRAFIVTVSSYGTLEVPSNSSKLKGLTCALPWALDIAGVTSIKISKKKYNFLRRELAKFINISNFRFKIIRF